MYFNIFSEPLSGIHVCSLFQLVLGSLLLLSSLVVATCWRIRQKTRQTLVQCGLPTVFWRPKFINYHPPNDANDDNDKSNDRKLASSTITNILPRMRALQGPYQMYGTVYGLSTAVVHVAHPTPARAILMGRPNKAPAYNHFFNFCGQGVFTADGSDWKDKRTAVLHALFMRDSSGGFEEQLAIRVNETARELLSSLDRQSTSRSKINIVPLLQRATIGLIYRYITHSKLAAVSEKNGLHDDRKEDDGSLESKTSSKTKTTEAKPAKVSPITACSSDLLTTYLQAIVRIRLIILAQSRSIWFLLPRWIYRTFSSLFVEEERTMGPIRQFAKLACHNAQPGSPLASLQSLPLYHNGSTPTAISDNLLHETITLLFAGQDTGAATLSWTLHLLSLYPEVQARLAKEVDTVMDQLGPDEIMTKRHLFKLPYLDAVLKESMRLYPVAPFVVRQISNPVTLPPENGSKTPIVLPKGALACIWIYALHRNPDFWERPDDFCPERWLDNTMTTEAYMPFAYGPRNCVGQPLAQIILRCLLAHLIHSYEFRDPNPVRKDMQAGFTVLPKGGVSLIWKKRQGKSC